MEIKLNLQQLRLDLQAHKGKEVNWTDIAIAVDEYNSLIYRYVNNQSSRVDLNVLAKLLDFFHREGLDVGIADLFVVTESETK